MRTLRPLLLALIIAGAFYLYTSSRRPQPQPTTGSSGPLSWFNGDKNISLTEAAGPENLDPEEAINVNVYKKAIPSVVNIKSRAVSYNFFYGLVPEEGQGTGFILDKEGHVLTNYHVVANAQKVEVTLHNRKTVPAEVVGADRHFDLAVLKISGTDFSPVTLGDSRTLQVGMKVFAIGNPFGLSGTMTRGIVSSIRSVRGPSGDSIDEAIQTDAAINPGNSGGPLLNSRGEVVGINSMIFTGGAEQSAGIGFAIPINTAKAVLNDLVNYGRVRRPSLGIAGLPIGPELADQMGLAADYGVLIMQVTPGSAAERSGLHGGNQRAMLGNTPIMLGGDLIVAIDGDNVEDMQDLSNALTKHKAGDTVTVTVYRGKKKIDVRLTLGEARTA
ncbi:MAG TPA: trypsin-like peptidase domain-containing protein [Terriglobales bacterium]|nr:trypsin-like peptidase domain-containing protein [Terriglobales bacterium]